MSPFVLAMLWRETRASWRRLLLFLLSISAGVGGLVAVHAFRHGLEQAIRVEARSLMASDLSLSSRRPFTPDERGALDDLVRGGARVAYGAGFAAMASAPGSGAVHLVDVRTVGPEYPFYGTVETASGRPFRELLTDHTLLAHPALLTRFNARVGDPLRLGQRTFTIAGEILREPDRAVQLLALGPQLLITAEAGEATGLIAPTSRIRYEALIKLPEGQDPLVVANQLKERLPERFARVRAYDESQPRVRRFLGRLTDYLNLVGLAALLLGGIGVAGAIRAFLGQKLDTLAILKCLGATSRQLITVYLCQAALLGLVGSVAGALLGLAVQGVLTNLLAEFLPVSFGYAVAWPAVWQGLGLGMLTTVWFALPPLLSVRGVPPARVFRRHVEASRSGRERWVGAGLTALSALVLVSGLILSQVGFGRLAGLAIGGLAATFVALHVSVWLLLTLLRRLPRPPSFGWRQGLASLYRPGNQTGAIVVSLGLGVLLVLSVYLIQTDLLRQLAANPPEEQPNLFLIDIQPDQKAGLTTLVTAHGLTAPELIPLVRGRLRAINGEKVELNSLDDNSRRRALRWEYAFTYRAALVDGEKVVAGAFAPMPGVTGAQVSVADWWAEATGLGVGARLTLDIQGIPVEATINSIREVDWANRRANFSFVFLPGVLERAPQIFVAALRVPDPVEREALQREVVGAFPNISIIDVAAIFRTVQEIVDRIGLVIQFMAGFSVAVGLVILAGTISTTKFQRIREAVLFKTLGATRHAVARVLATEYLVMGLLAGLVGGAAAGGMGWVLVRYVFEGEWQWRPAPYLVAWGVTAALIAVAGLGSSVDVLVKKPLQVLRED